MRITRWNGCPPLDEDESGIVTRRGGGRDSVATWAMNWRVIGQSSIMKAIQSVIVNVLLYCTVVYLGSGSGHTGLTLRFFFD